MNVDKFFLTFCQIFAGNTSKRLDFGHFNNYNLCLSQYAIALVYVLRKQTKSKPVCIQTFRSIFRSNTQNLPRFMRTHEVA